MQMLYLSVVIPLISQTALTALEAEESLIDCAHNVERFSSIAAAILNE